MPALERLFQKMEIYFLKAFHHNLRLAQRLRRKKGVTVSQSSNCKAVRQGKAPVSGGHKERLLLWDMVQGQEAGKFLGAGRAKGVQLDCLGAIMGQRVQKFCQGVFHHKTLRILGTGNIQFLAGEKDSFQRHCLIPRFLPFNL